jgi:hypothetical protein
VPIKVVPNLYICRPSEAMDLTMDYVYTPWASSAKRYLEQGHVVVVPDEDVAHLAMLLSGLSVEEADQRIDAALDSP